MKNKLNKLITILFIILFPLGIIYCVGKCLFANSIAGFIGALLLCVAGFCIGVYLYDIGVLTPAVEFVKEKIITLWR